MTPKLRELLDEIEFQAYGNALETKGRAIQSDSIELHKLAEFCRGQVVTARHIRYLLETRAAEYLDTSTALVAASEALLRAAEGVLRADSPEWKAVHMDRLSKAVEKVKEAAKS